LKKFKSYEEIFYKVEKTGVERCIELIVIAVIGEVFGLVNGVVSFC